MASQAKETCSLGYQCANLDPLHRFLFNHLSAAPPANFQVIPEPDNEDEDKELPPCRYGADCRMLRRGEEVHCQRFSHPILAPTPGPMYNGEPVYAPIPAPIPAPAYYEEPAHAPIPAPAYYEEDKKMPPCRYGADCRMLRRGEEVHCQRFSHPAPAPAPVNHPCWHHSDCRMLQRYFGGTGSASDIQHVGDYSHPCIYGRNCQFQGPDHNKFFSH